MTDPLVKTYNLNQKQWLELKPLLEEKGHGYWNVIDQWNRTTYAMRGNKFLRTPISLILLKSSQKFIIIVWGKAAWETEDFIEEKHSVNGVLQELPPLFHYTP